MKVLHYKDPETNELFREITDKSYTALQELKRAYEEKGKKAWFNLFDISGEWQLTINLGKEGK